MTASSPRASILIPTHDNVTTLPMSVRSALDQSVNEIEVLVCGDGVTDRAREVILTLVDSDDRVVFLDMPKGPHRGEIRRHEAILSARSDVIVYLCDDDLLLPDHVADLLDLLAEHDMVQSLNGRVDPNGDVTLYPGVLDDPGTVPAILRDDIRYNSVSLTGTAHRRSTYLDLGAHWETTPENTWPDHHQWRRMLLAGPLRAATSRRMTALQFPSNEHGRSGWDVEQRRAEVARWADFVARPDAQHELDRLVFEGAVRQIGDVYRQLLDVEASWELTRSELARSLSDVVDLQLQRERLTLDRDQARVEIAALRSTLSWRITAPLRAVRRRFRR